MLRLQRSGQRVRSYLALLYGFSILFSIQGGALNLLELPNYVEQAVPDYIH
jgi:hypothetical protein